MKYQVEFYLHHKYDVGYGEYSEEEKLYKNEVEASTDRGAIMLATMAMNELAEYKNKFGFDGRIVAKRLKKIMRIDHEEIITSIPLS